MRNVVKLSSLLLLFIVLLASCSTKKKVVNPLLDNNIAGVALAELPSMAPDSLSLGSLSSNVKLALKVGKDNIPLSGKMRLQGGEGVQISITPLGLVEVACIEFLPPNIRLIYKIKKILSDVPYSEARAIGLSGISYGVLESLFLNRVFIPDGRSALHSPGEIGLEQQGDHIVLTAGDQAAIVYRFFIEKATGNLVRSEGVSSTGESFVCEYSAFTNLNGRPFPSRMTLSFKGDANVTMDIEHSKMSIKPFNFASRSVGSSYRKLSVGEFIKSVK